MPDFILECKPVKVKSDSFETGGEDTMSCHTFITLVNPDPDTAHKIVKSTLDQILGSVFDLGVISLVPTAPRASACKFIALCVCSHSMVKYVNIFGNDTATDKYIFTLKGSFSLLSNVCQRITTKLVQLETLKFFWRILQIIDQG